MLVLTMPAYTLRVKLAETSANSDPISKQSKNKLNKERVARYRKRVKEDTEAQQKFLVKNREYVQKHRQKK